MTAQSVQHDCWHSVRHHQPRRDGRPVTWWLVALCMTMSANLNARAEEPRQNAAPFRRVEKLIPDIKILKDSPPTILELQDLLDAKSELNPSHKPSARVIYNPKPKVVDADVSQQNQLVIKPGKLGKTEIILELDNGDGMTSHNKFTVRVWEPDYWTLALTVIGGLGVFLLGMKHMSEGMQAIAGNSLRRMISAVTSHPLMATGVGVLFTMLVQSSSITTVMVVGFVNSGLMTLSQGIGVVMGANIGTTITGWILVLKIGKYGLPLVGVSAFVYLFSRREKLRYIALPFLGLGMVFLGLDLMKNGFAMVKELPAFEAWFHQFDTETYFGILSCAMVGCVLTFIVQSSSATLGITIGLAQINVIPFETAAALVMGENIGTTITAWLASLGTTTTNAKRVAYFHVLFNLVGVLWITSIFHPYLKLVGVLVTGDFSDPVVVTAAIATTHTVFNVTNTLLFLGLTGPSARLLTRLIPDRQTRLQETKLTTLDIRMLETPSIAVEQSRSEISNMSTSCLDMMGQLRDVNQVNPTDDRAFDDILKQEALLDCYQTEVVEFMSHLLSANIPHALTDEIRSQLRLADEYESVSDCIASVVKACRKLHHQGHTLPEREQTSLLELHDLTTTFLKNVARAYTDDSTIDMSAAKEQADQVTRQVKQLASIAFSQSSQDTEPKLEPQVTVAYNRQLTAYRRIRDHILNIAEAVSGIK